MTTAAVYTQAGMMRALDESVGAARVPAADMADLAEVIRAFLAIEARSGARVRLGSGLFDVVITSSDVQARRVVTVIDEVQGGCGPVIEDPENGWLYWLVPPGSCARWAWHGHAVCLGAPHTITLPSPSRRVAPGPYWLRAPAGDRLVPMAPLWDALAQFRPEPTPHAALAARLGISV
ncbi:hypothetical protein GCM10009566_42990 [Streptomyces murinus]|uniref:Uncharacterized protein n=1 Tax=Streptomyces murinus TaxID=33900 RepID=A0A7W3NI66_STRMR|nr:hypothetical protein [Streptomyces murinus]MBA9050903.1 hypothetical protein [Streptomyces murinus]